MKKSLTVILALLLIMASMCLAPLTTTVAELEIRPEEPLPQELADAFSDFATMDSCHMEWDLYFQASVHIAYGNAVMDMPISMTCHAGTDWQKEPMLIRSNIDASILAFSEAESQNCILYAAQAEDAIELYLSTDEGVTWSASEIGTSDLPTTGMQDMQAALSTGLQNVRKEGTVTTDGQEVVLYTGKLRMSEYLKETLATAEDADAEAFSAILASSDALFNSESVMDMAFYVDAETHRLLGGSLEMGAFLQDMIPFIVESITTGEGFDIVITEANLEWRLTNVNAIAPIVIPEAALATNKYTEQQPEDADDRYAEPMMAGDQVQYSVGKLEEVLDAGGTPCVSIRLIARPGDTLTIVLPNQEDYVVQNTSNNDQPYQLTIHKSCFFPNVPLTDSVYTVTPQILVTHDDGTMESLEIDSFEITFPTVQLELTDPAQATIPEEGIMAAEGNEIALKGKVDDHTVIVTVNGQPVTSMYQGGYFEYTYILSGESPETVIIEAGKPNCVSTAIAFTVIPHGES